MRLNWSTSFLTDGNSREGPATLQSTPQAPTTEIYLSVPICELFGAGTCGKYLLRELSKRHQVRYLPTADKSVELADPETRALAEKLLTELTSDVEAPLIQFAGPKLEQQTKFKGKPNVGYVFFEWEPVTEEQKANLKAFDVVIAGSKWNSEVIRRCGIESHSVPQGVDTDVFRPMPRATLKDKFVIYSGGKYEPRKAQDLVIKAYKVLRDRHDDICLVTSWFNLWSKDQKGFQGPGVFQLPLMGHGELCHYMNQTDVGLFPNRCEGGTNLVLMDYMACGKPVIANDSTGQADVLGTNIRINGSDDELVDRMIEETESLYKHGSRLKQLGIEAREEMKKWSWERTANDIYACLR